MICSLLSFQNGLVEQKLSLKQNPYFPATPGLFRSAQSGRTVSLTLSDKSFFAPREKALARAGCAFIQGLAVV